MSNDDQTIKADNTVPAISSGTHQQGEQLLHTGVMQPPQAPGTIGTIGKYQVLRVLGEGGMGQVLLALDPVTDSPVAIKIIKPEYLAKDWAVHRFLTEARHMFKLVHPSIIRVLEVSDRQEGPYFVMPFLAGGSLAQKIKPGESLPAGEILSVGRNVAEALHYAHAHGIIHRDLKPSNILLDGEGRAFLCDFGLLRTVFNDSIVDVTRPQMEGTVPYMSPAVAEGKAEDTRCDIYGFGCLLYEMLTGQPPYQGPSVDTILKQIQAGPPQPIRQVNPGAPAPLVAIAEGAMARELRDRYAAMADVIADLERVEQRKPPLGPHGHVLRSHAGRKIAGIVGILALLGLGSFGVLHFLNDRAASHAQTSRDATPGTAAVSSPKETAHTDFTYTINNGAITITKYTGPDGDVTIPSTINGFPVTIIGDSAFMFRGDVVSVTIPNSVTRIGDVAFWGCSHLTDVTLGNSIRTIGGQAFGACSSLTRITIPNSVNRIFGQAFRHSGLKSVTIPSSVTSIMDATPFNGCQDLISISVDAANPAYRNDLDGVLFNKDKTSLIGYPGGKVGSYLVPNGVTSIACWAFSGASELTNVTIPASVTSIHARAFVACGRLVSITVEASNPLYCSSSDGVLFNKDQTNLASYPGGKSGGYEIPNGVTKIGQNAFQECPYLTTVTIPESVTDIGAEGFRGCGNLTVVYFKGNAPRLEQDVFTDSNKVKIYYQPGAKGWGGEFGGRPVASQSIPAPPALAQSVINRSNSSPSPGVAPPVARRRVIVPPLPSPDSRSTYAERHASRQQTIERLKQSLETSSDSSSQERLANMIAMLEKADAEDAAKTKSAEPPAAPPEHFTCTSNNGAITITKYTGPGGDVTIPRAIKGLAVTIIGNDAFRGNGNLVSVTIPDSVTSIGREAFRECAELTGVTIPSRVTNIEWGAFWGCLRLTKVTIPKSVTSIGDNAFNNCPSLRSIEVDGENPAYCNSAGGVVFDKQKTKLICYPGGRIGSYEIPNGVTEIGNYAFEHCHLLTRVTFPESVASIADHAFVSCSGLTSAVLNKGLKQIGGWAFHECAKLTRIAIPDSVTSIGRQAFFDCSSLTDVTIGKGVTSIDPQPFLRCANLVAIKVDRANPAYCSSDDGVVFNKDKTLLVCFPTGKAGSYAIPKGVTKIFEGAFQWCTSLTDVTIPDGVTVIGRDAFNLCSSLTKVVIPDSVRIIDGWAFANCANLASAKVPARVNNIGQAAFGGRIKLASVTIPDSVVSLGLNPFDGGWDGGNGIASISVDAANPSYCSSEDGVLFDKEKTTVIGYPPAKPGSHTIPGGVARIADYAFQGCHGLTRLIVPGSVTVVGNRAFMACPNLASIVFQGDAPKIESDPYLFWGNGRLTIFYQPGTKGWGKTLFDRPVLPLSGDFGYTSENNSVTIVKYAGPGGAITIPDKINGLPVTRIGNDAFRDCTNLTSVTIPGSVGSIGEWAFVGCSNLTGVTIADGVNSVGITSFYKCPSLTVMKIPASVTSIGRGAFSYCTKLDSIVVDAANPAYSSVDGVLFNKEKTCLVSFAAGKSGSYAIPGTVTEVGPNAFEGSDKLTSVTIPEGVTTLGRWAFVACDKLTSVQIPNSVTVIGGSAFEKCTSLSKVTIGNRVTNIEGGAFYDCAKLTNIAIPDSVTRIGDRVFRGCTSLTNVTIPRGVTSVGINPFDVCSSLPAITVDAENPAYCSTGDGVLFDKKMTCLIGYPGGRAGSYVVPAGVTTIGDSAFAGSTKLTRVTIPASVTRVGNCGFWGCTNLTGIYFQGNAPTGGNNGSILDGAKDATVYYQPGTTGWGKHFGGRLTAPLDIPEKAEMKPALLGNVAGPLASPPDHFTYTTNNGAVTITKYTGPGEEVTIPSMINGLPVTGIKDGTFRDCTKITSVTIPASVTSIDVNAFVSQRSGLLSIAVDAANPAFSSADGVLFSKDKKCLVSYPGGKPGGYVIPQGVTTIGGFAFHGCNKLTSVTIPDSVNNIGHGAFRGCSGLSAITIPASVTSMGPNPFLDSGLSSISVDAANPAYCSTSDGGLFDKKKTCLLSYAACKSKIYVIPDTVTSIATDAFSGVTSLTDVTIPDSVTSVSVCAFYGCSGLTRIKLSNRLTLIDQCVFVGCSGLSAVTIPASVTRIEYAAFPGCSGLTKITIPASVKAICHSAFAGCTSLAKIVISDGVTELGDWAFARCLLTNVEIPKSVTSIAGTAFAGCRGLSSFTVDHANPAYVSVDGFLYNKDKTRFISCPGGKEGNFEVPNGVTNINENAFRECPMLTSVTIPESVTSIGKEAFRGCGNLTAVCFKGNAPRFEQEVFVDSNKVKIYYQPGAKGWGGEFGGRPTAPLDIPEKAEMKPAVKGNVAGPLASPPDHFTYTTNNGAVTITKYTGPGGNVVFPKMIDGSVVTSIGEYAFRDCNTVVHVRIPNNITNIAGSAFGGSSRLLAIEVDAENPAYCSTDGVVLNQQKTTLICYPSGKSGSYSVPNSVANIGDWAFVDCVLTEVTIPKSVTAIGSGAFWGCGKLTAITIPNSVASITPEAFSHCRSLNSIAVDVGNPTYSSVDGVVFNKEKTSLLIYPGGKAGRYAIPNGVTCIKARAFLGCSGLTSVVLPNSITTIEETAFGDSGGLMEACFEGNAPSGASDSSIFRNNDKVTIYYLTSTKGWGKSFGHRPTAPWNPQAQTKPKGP